MEKYFRILTGLKEAISYNNINNFRQLTTDLIEYTSNEENQISLRGYRDDAGNSIRSTNLVILASKYNRANILKDLFDPDTTILNNLSIIKTILPDDEDEELHNAFYYAIRWCNIELLDTLINKWPDNYFAVHLEKLDEILSRAYDELQLKNVPLSNEIEIFVEQKLINLRFFSNAPRNDANILGDLNNTLGRIELVLKKISLLKMDYSKQKKVDGKFLFVAKSIAQNIHVLKQRLKSTYATLPWEEMEFCLVIFVSSHIKCHEMNFIFRATLNKSKILKHLENFAEKLKEQKEIIKGTTIELFKFPTLERKKVVPIIKNNYPQFKELYMDYDQIRDVYSLEKINDSIKLALSADPKETEGQLIITRVLQVIGENVKNTHASPKLSDTTSAFFVLSLPKNTRQIIAGLRDSLSHDDSLSKRMEIEENADINFFINIKNDVKKVGDVINNILFNNKMETVRKLLKQFVDGENYDDIIEIAEVLSAVRLDKMLPSSTFKMLEHEKLEMLLKDLSNNITDKTNYEQELFNEMCEIINSLGAQSENNRTNYETGFLFFQCATMFLIDNKKTDHNIIRRAKSFANQTLLNFISKVKPNDLKKIVQLSIDLLSSVESRKPKHELVDIDTLITSIYSTAEFARSDIKWVEELSEMLNNKRSGNNACAKKKTANVTEIKRNDEPLTQKLSKLKTILSNYTVSGPLIIEKLFSYKRDSKIQALVEILVLDIMSILDNSKHDKLENNLLLLDDHTPLLTGRCLRNHLAHDNALFAVLSSDPSIAVILNAEKLTEENLIKSTKKIGKVIGDDISKLEEKYNQGLDTITNQEKMFVALEERKMENLKNCVNNGADINARSINLWTTLHFAAKGGSLEVVKFIHDQNVNVKLTDNRGQTPLHIAAKYGWQDIVEYFILNNKEALCVDVRNDISRTPLHVAAQNGHKDTVEILLKHNADAVTHDISELSPLHYAIRNDHMEIVKILFKIDVSFNINKAMHEAAERGNLELVNLLLCNKAEVNARTDGNEIPLHVAAKTGHYEVVKALILKGADVNARSVIGRSVLSYAVENGYENIVKLLLLCGANVDAAPEMCNCTPLQHAITKGGYVGIVKTLLINEADANTGNAKGITALHYAVLLQHLDIVAVLLEHGVNIHAKDIDDQTPLHYAAIRGHKEVAELLIQKIGDINANNDHYLTTIHHAAENGHKDVLDLLIKNKAKVNARNAGGFTPLHAAAKNGSLDIIDLLIKNNAEVNAKANNDITPLHVAARYGHGKAVDFLIKKEADVTAPCPDGTPLLQAVVEGHIEVVEILAQYGADIKNMNITLLINAIGHNHNNIVEFLIAKVANVNAENGKALFTAIYYGNTDIVKILLKNNASVKVRNSKNATPLHIAAKAGYKKIVEALIKSGADVEPENTVNVITPLCLAALEGHEGVATLLIKNGANVNVRCSTDGTTPLHLAAEKGHTNVVKVLLENKAIISVKNNKDKTPIKLAVANGHLKVVVRLLEFNKEIIINAKFKSDFTLLHIASQGSNLELIKYLVDEGFDINAKNAYGSKPIHIAAIEGYTDTVEYFISKGASINDTDGTKQTLLHCATTNGHLKVVKYLIAQGANINAKTTQGLTAMHIAVNFGSKDVIEVLLQYGAIYNAIDESHRTPSSTAKNTDVINLFESTDKLFEAAKRNSPLEVEDYIKAGAFINAKNVECDTPLYYAARKGYHEVVNVLLKNNANPNVVDNKGFTPLHYAAEFAHLKIIKALLSKNAVYNAVSKDGKKPSDFIGNEEINSLFKLVNEAFTDIKNGNLQVIDYLNKITDIDTVKAVMGACDGENRTLVVAAVHSNFSQVNQLKEISQGDLSVHITEALKLLDKGNSEKALGMLESAMEKRKEVLGSDNPGTLDIQTYIATALCKLGDYSKALNILNEICHKQEKMRGKYDKDTLRTRGIIALVLYEQGNDKEAFNIYQEVHQKQMEILGPDHCDTLCTQIGMSLVLVNLGKSEEALHMILTAFSKKKATMGSDHIDTMQAQHNIAMVYACQGESEKAIKIFKTVYENRKKVLGVNNPNTLRTLYYIATVLFNQYKNSEALKVSEEVLINQEKVLGQNHPHTLKTRYKMAKILSRQGNFFSAYKTYKEVLEQMKIVYEPNNRYVLKVLKTMENLNWSFKLHQIDISKVLHNMQNDINVAASNADIQIVQRLLKDGADPNKKDIDGRRPLHCAVSYGHLSVMKILLQNGADIARATNKVNTTLLHTATAKDYKEIVDVLLQHASRDKLNEFINAKTTFNGDTSLHIAVNNGALHIIKSLLKRGAIYNIKNNEGKTPLDLSLDQYENNFLKLVEELFEDAKSGNVQIIGKLKSITPDDFKAVTNARNNKGNTLLQVAIDNKHEIVVNKLLEMLKLSDQGEQVNVSHNIL